MRTLLDESFSGLDLTSEQQIATVTVTDRPITLLIQFAVHGTSGAGGEYLVDVVVDEYLVVPSRKVFVEPGNTRMLFQSRDLMLYRNGVLALSVKGLAGDTDVSGRVLILETSPVTTQEVTTAIDGSTDQLISAVSDAVARMTINVSEKETVLGVCPTPVSKNLPSVIPQQAVNMPRHAPDGVVRVPRFER